MELTPLLIGIVALLQLLSLAKELWWKNPGHEAISRDEFEKRLRHMDERHMDTNDRVNGLIGSMNDLRVEIAKLATVIERGLLQRDGYG